MGQRHVRGVEALSSLRFGRRRAASGILGLIQSCCIFLKIQHTSSTILLPRAHLCSRFCNNKQLRLRLRYWQPFKSIQRQLVRVTVTVSRSLASHRHRRRDLPAHPDLRFAQCVCRVYILKVTAALKLALFMNSGVGNVWRRVCISVETSARRQAREVTPRDSRAVNLDKLLYQLSPALTDLPARPECLPRRLHAPCLRETRPSVNIPDNK